MIGTTLSHFTLLEILGAGGMGVVYRARDLRLERDVALKVLPDGVLADERTRDRFRQEALALSRLNHPNIATVHDFDRHEGVDFLVMERVVGPTLAQRIAAGALGEGEVIAIGLQIAEALATAHEGGVVHRDLKPGNVALAESGLVKLLDFGISRLLDDCRAAADTSSLDGALPVGTLAYMAPEQLLGKGSDARSDIFAAGVVLYEMATGKQPFMAALATALVYEITNQAPARPGRLRPDLSRRLEETILKCLEKNPAHRYQSARELAVDLRRAAGAPDSGEEGKRAARRIESLAVLPLANLSGDPEQEYFADGMTDALIADLSQIAALRVISRTSIMRYKGSKKSIPEIAGELRVDAMIEGTVVRSGDRVRISAQLVEAISERNLWSRTYQRGTGDVLELQAEVAREIAKEIRLELMPHENARLAAPRKVLPEAYEAYLRGRHFWNRRSDAEVRRSIEFFQKAIEIEPTYGLAWSGLADAYNILGTNAVLPPLDAFPKAKAAATRALEIDAMLPQAHVSLAYALHYSDWEWAAAEREYKLAIALAPGYATGHQWYGQLLGNLGRHELAIEEARLAETLDPLSLILTTSLAEVLFYARRYDEAMERLQRTIDLDPSFSPRNGIWAASISRRRCTPKALPSTRTRSATRAATSAALR